MASVARDDLHIIQIPRKAIVAEVAKKLGGSEPQYECWFEDGKFHSIAKTIIASTEPNTSGKLEQIMGCFANTIKAAEEEAATALLGLLKRNYRLAIDDINFMERARIERQKEDRERYVQAAMSAQHKQAQTICQLSKGWDQLLGDMEAVQEVCELVCGTVMTIPPTGDAGRAKTEIATMLCELNEWSREEIYESTANLKETIEQAKL